MGTCTDHTTETMVGLRPTFVWSCCTHSCLRSDVDRLCADCVLAHDVCDLIATNERKPPTFGAAKPLLHLFHGGAHTAGVISIRMSVLQSLTESRMFL